MRRLAPTILLTRFQSRSCGSSRPSSLVIRHPVRLPASVNKMLTYLQAPWPIRKLNDICSPVAGLLIDT